MWVFCYLVMWMNYVIGSLLASAANIYKPNRGIFLFFCSIFSTFILVPFIMIAVFCSEVKGIIKHVRKVK